MFIYIPELTGGGKGAQQHTHANNQAAKGLEHAKKKWIKVQKKKGLVVLAMEPNSKVYGQNNHQAVVVVEPVVAAD